jgi:hypothetical protein
VVNPIRFLVSNYLASNRGVLLMTEEFEVTLEDGRTITVRQKPVEPSVKDPVRDARTIQELQALIDNEAEHPDLAIRASQRITELVAACIRGEDRMPLLTRVKIGNETVTLDQHDCALLRQKLAEGQISVARCQDHKRERCDCWLPTRNFVWNLQRTRPDCAITKASELVWTAVEDFARKYTKPKEVDPVLSALVEMIESQGDPPWLGKRSERGIQNQKANAARRREHDFR